MFYNYFDEYTNFLGPIAIFLIVLLVLISIVMYIFGALGLMALAKKNKLDNPWLAFIPVGSSYLLGKLGFEVYSSKEEKKSNFNLDIIWSISCFLYCWKFLRKYRFYYYNCFYGFSL